MTTHVSQPRAAAPEVVRVRWGRLPGVRVGLVLWGGLAVLDLARIVAAPSYLTVGLLAALVAAAAVRMPTATGLGAAVVGWLLVDGFVEHRYGVLGFDAAHDGRVLVVLVGVALVGTRVTR